MKKSRGIRYVKVLNQGRIVAESTFVVDSDEWLLLRPTPYPR